MERMPTVRHFSLNETERRGAEYWQNENSTHVPGIAMTFHKRDVPTHKKEMAPQVGLESTLQRSFNEMQVGG
jgi:hypothetical protein